ncbi:unnamed protein product [Closterium sp. NIES-54]
MGHFIPTNATATAEAIARLFFDRIITIHGIPATLISDRDPKFTSKFWKELMGLLGTKLAMSSAYHPQTDGQTERLNQVVEQLLRTACKDDVSHWDTQLPTLEFAYNNASHAATGKTPFFLCYGREPLTPQQPTTPAHVQAVHDFYANRQRRDHSVAVGDQVLLDTRNLNLSHLPSKLRPRFCGPFLVEAQVTPVTFRLRLPDTWKLHNAFHVQLLTPYKDPNQQFQGRQLPPPPPVLVQDDPEYEVERVLTQRRRGGKTLEFLLRWKGYDPTEDSWVVEADMGNARRALKDYLSDLARAANPTVTRSLATLVMDPTCSSAAASALVAELIDFAATCHLDYLASEVPLGCDVLEDSKFELEYLAATVPHLAAMLLSPERDPGALNIPTPRSYAEAIPCP